MAVSPTSRCPIFTAQAVAAHRSAASSVTGHLKEAGDLGRQVGIVDMALEQRGQERLDRARHLHALGEVSSSPLLHKHPPLMRRTSVAVISSLSAHLSSAALFGLHLALVLLLDLDRVVDEVVEQHRNRHLLQSGHVVRIIAKCASVFCILLKGLET
jgi:hypothetical protein